MSDIVPHGHEFSGLSRDLIKQIASEIGASTVAYVEVMYPEAITSTSSTFKLSLRNHIHNEIMSISGIHDEASMRKWVAGSKKFRLEWVKQWRKLRKAK